MGFPGSMAGYVERKGNTKRRHRTTRCRQRYSRNSLMTDGAKIFRLVMEDVFFVFFIHFIGRIVCK